MLSEQLSKGALRFQSRLKELGIGEFDIKQLPGSTRTAEEAASAIGCEVDQIAKSIIFKMKNAGEAVLVITSGKNRVNEMMVEILIDDELEKADADFVKQVTGYAIGGVPPVAHSFPIMTFIDEDLMTYDTIWAAAGDGRAVFELTPKDLKAMTLAEVTNVGIKPE